MAAITAVKPAATIQDIRHTAPITLPDLTPRTKPMVGVHPLLKMGLLTGFLLMAALYSHTVFVEHKANTKQMEIIKIKEQNAILQANLTELKTLSNVEKKALGLGMMPVEQFHYIEIQPELYAMSEQLPALVTPHQNETASVPLGF